MSKNAALLIFDSGTLSAAQIVDHHNGFIGSLFAELKRADEIEFLLSNSSS